MTEDGRIISVQKITRRRSRYALAVITLGTASGYIIIPGIGTGICSPELRKSYLV